MADQLTFPGVFPILSALARVLVAALAGWLASIWAGPVVGVIVGILAFSLSPTGFLKAWRATKEAGLRARVYGFLRGFVVAWGAAAMAAVAALVYWLISKWFGVTAGVIGALLFLLAWCLFNLRSGTTGLFKANLNSYFAYRRGGQSVEEAIASMVRSRYRWFSKERGQQVLQMVALGQEVSEEARVCDAVYIIFCLEAGFPPEGRKFVDEIHRIYRDVAERHTLPA